MQCCADTILNKVFLHLFIQAEHETEQAASTILDIFSVIQRRI